MAIRKRGNKLDEGFTKASGIINPEDIKGKENNTQNNSKV